MKKHRFIFSVWLKQRTRWFKGWYQTWLVHMRHPISLYRDLGLKGWMVFHVMTTGMIVSALLHPMFVYFVASNVFRFIDSGSFPPFSSPIFLMDLVTITTSYTAVGLLAWHTLPLRRLGHLRTALWSIPIYWLCLSIAAWRAVWHLILRPHEWEKTPHRLMGQLPNAISYELELNQISNVR